MTMPATPDTGCIQRAGDSLTAGLHARAASGYLQSAWRQAHMAESVKFLYSRFLSASTLIGAQVRNPQNESLGDLKDVMIDTASGKIAYGVLSFGGVLGVGNKLFAVPWDSFRVDPEKERLVLDVLERRLEDAPGFDADHWPNVADPNVAGEVDGHYAASTTREHQILHPD